MKPWWESRVIWLNAVTLVVSVLTALLGTQLVQDHPTVMSWMAASVAVANVVLRCLTTTEIGKTP